MSTKTIDTQIEAIVAQNHAGLIYIGASWCAPCKAMRPLLLIEVEKPPQISFHELDLTAYAEGYSSVYVQGLPAFLQFRQGRVVQVLSGMLTLAQLQQLVRLDENHAQIKPQNTDLPMVQAVTAMKALVAEMAIAEALSFYQQLDAAIKYNPDLQRLKSRCDLILGAKQYQQQEKPGEHQTMLQDFACGQIEQGLVSMQPHQLQDEILRQWYVHGINCLEDSERAADFRKKLNQG